ncbi:hypothetical protein TNCV_485461 [Trichonephila clavipes]|nr:hypothetical protein TNCV_485461 [Trichonephila clavipes]
MTLVPLEVPSPCAGAESARGRTASGALLLVDEYLVFWSGENRLREMFEFVECKFRKVVVLIKNRYISVDVVGMVEILRC